MIYLQPCQLIFHFVDIPLGQLTQNYILSLGKPDLKGPRAQGFLPNSRTMQLSVSTAFILSQKGKEFFLVILVHVGKAIESADVVLVVRVVGPHDVTHVVDGRFNVNVLGVKPEKGQG